MRRDVQEDPPAPGSTILIVGEPGSLRTGIEEILRRAGHEPVCLPSPAEAWPRVALSRPDVLLLSVSPDDGERVQLASACARHHPEVSVIFWSRDDSTPTTRAKEDQVSPDRWDEREGPDALLRVVRRGLEVAALRRENGALRARLAVEGALEPIVGPSRALEGLRSAVRLLAPAPSTVLILGESGVGKTLLARTLHQGSPRRGGPLHAVNCAAVPSGGIEGELFGRGGGAADGVSGTSPGCLERAHGGTLLLEEVAELDPALVPRLLRVLEEREVRRAGGGEPESVDVRVIATATAARSDGPETARSRATPEGLFARLDPVRLCIPPLRERREDILPLAEAFLSRARRGTGRPAPRLGAEAARSLLEHDWPGNVRELRNAIERAVLLCAKEELRAEHLLLEPTWARRTRPNPVGETLYERERDWILQVLRDTGGNRTAAARRLGVSVRTVRNKLAAYQKEGSEIGPRSLPARRFAG